MEQNPVTLKQLYQQTRQVFAEQLIDQPALDARVLICAALQITHEQFILRDSDVVSAIDRARIDDFIQQRLKFRPVAKIIGYKEFYGRDFKTTDATLDPRPDSETLIDTVLRYVALRGGADTVLRILDLGTGTGCLALTLLAELPNASALAIDRSANALAIARENAENLGVNDRIDLRQSDWFSAVDAVEDGAFDVIISNPPYIPDADIDGLAVDVRVFDPYDALAGGQDGLDPYRIIIPHLHMFLRSGGLAAFELGQGQAPAIVTMLQQAGFADVTTDHDLAGIGRVVHGIF